MFFHDGAKSGINERSGEVIILGHSFTSKYMLVYRIMSLEFENENLSKAYLKVEICCATPTTNEPFY